MNETRDGGGLQPLRPDRLTELTRGLAWRRVVLVRRVAAGLLGLVALLLAVRQPDSTAGAVPVLVAARDLAPGSTLHASDVMTKKWPRELLPTEVLSATDQVEGKVLAGAANMGEPLTAPRLVGPQLTQRASGRTDEASVPIRLSDPAVAELLSPGRLVDVVTVGQRSDRPSVLATGASVLTVLPPDATHSGSHGRLVLIAVPRAAATKLAAATLSQEVTVTLH